MSETKEIITQEQFIERFVKRIVERSPRPAFDDGESVEEYARATAPSYWEQEHQRAEGPEECADSDMSYWGES